MQSGTSVGGECCLRRSVGTLIILFTDLASQDTKGEIMGIATAINAFSFGIISFLRGAMQTFDEQLPLIASFILMILDWSVFKAGT